MNIITSATQLVQIVLDAVKSVSKSVPSGTEIRILEAGCGNHMPFDLKGIPHRLIGVDLDETALRIRQERKDLHQAIVGDLRHVSLPSDSFDVIYNRYVLEHVDGAEIVLGNFIRWLKPGGIMILMFPDRDSVYGFFARVTPFYLHVLYKRRIRGLKNAGKPGYDPYPTVYDHVLASKRFRQYAEEHQLTIVEEHGFAYFLPAWQAGFSKLVEILTLGKLTSRHVNLLYILRK